MELWQRDHLFGEIRRRLPNAMTGVFAGTGAPSSRWRAVVTTPAQPELEPIWYNERGRREMGAQIVFEVQAQAPCDPAAVYKLLSDGATWPEWSPIGSFKLEREGTEGGETAGAIRAFKTGTITSREELVEVRPHFSLSYRSLSGLPIRHHLATVGLTPSERGTTITWREEFEPKVPGTGWLLARFLHRFVQRCADGLAAQAGRQA
jgi:hypothetical protein